jgi:hypothetical protein
MPVDQASPVGGVYGLVGLYVPPIPLLPTVLAFNPNLFPEHELFVGNEWLDGALRHNKLRRVRRYETPGTAMDTIKNVNTADVSASLTPNGMGFGSTRSNRTVPVQPGVPVTVAMWVFGSTFNYLTEFPDDQAPTVNTPFDIFSNSVFLLGIACHQGRTVAQEATAYGQGVNTQTFMGENLVWSGVNDVTPANWNLAIPQVFVPENPSGFAFLCSMSANELFAVKITGGMYASGDLNNPTVVTLPMVVGSEVIHTPVQTDVGVVYGNGASGVWAWPHGDSSNLLSDKMDPSFWLLNAPNSDFDVFGGVRYQFSRCDEWVLVPNNWIYDTRLSSWWRMEDPAITQIRMWTCMSHFIYGSQSFYTNAAPTPISMWERNTPTTSFSWQSQPLWETIGNLVDAREITIRAIGTGTVTVTLTGESQVPASCQFQVNSSLPVLLRDNLRVQDANIAVKIESQGLIAAPTVYECNVGYIATQKQPVQGTP